MNFVTLNTIIRDIQNIIRGATITDDEPISERQIEAWIHQYRAQILKRDLDKNKIVNPDYVQDIPVLELTAIDKLNDSTITSGTNVYRTIEIPNAIDLNHQSGLLYVGDSLGNQIQLVSENRVPWMDHSKYSKLMPVAYLKDNRIYVQNHNALQFISVRGVFENPVAIYNIVNPRTNQQEATLDTPYPFPIDKLPQLKKEVLSGELQIEWNAPNDDVNDADHSLESDVLR